MSAAGWIAVALSTGILACLAVANHHYKTAKHYHLRAKVHLAQGEHRAARKVQAVVDAEALRACDYVLCALFLAAAVCAVVIA